MKRKHYIYSLFLVLTFLIFSTNIVVAKPRVTGKPPAAPTGLTASGITTSETTLSWTAVSGATGYKVFRATPNDSNYVQVATVSTNSYKNTGLTAATAYWYFVRAYNSYGTSVDSTHIKAATSSVVVQAPGKLIFGYAVYYYSGDSSSYNSMVNNSLLINEIGTDTYKTDGLGNVTGLVPTNQLTYANSNNIKSLAMITNNFDGSIAKTLLESSANRQNLITNITAALKANGYKGVNVDLEGVYAADRSYYTTFISELYNALKPQGFMVTAAVPAKTYDSTTDGWSGAFDYAALSSYVDQLVLMTYDEHYPGGTAGPIASIGWVQKVINYAITVVPKEKLLLGTAAYGYDWSSNGTKAYSISQCNNLAATYGVQIQWDPVSQSPYFNYTDSTGIQHTVWFENGTSLGYKLDLVNTSNISGIAIWRLGLEDSNYWSTIKIKFNK